MTKQEETLPRQSEKTCKIIFCQKYFDSLVEEDGLFVTYDESLKGWNSSTDGPVYYTDESVSDADNEGVVKPVP